MHTICIRTKTGLPHLFAGEDQHGRGIANQRVEQYVEHRAVRHPLGVGRRVAIEAILADIEEEGRQVFIREIGQQADIAVKVEVAHRLPKLCIHLGQQVEHIALQFRHVRNSDLFGIRKAVERAQQIAEGVAQFAILVGHALQNLFADAVVLGEVDGQRPQPQDIRAIVAHQVERVDRIAQRLGHFHALLVHRKAVGQHRIIGRPPTRAAALQQARLEPAAMLVAAFEIEVGGPLQIGPPSAFQREHMGAARIKPDVENVGHALIVGECVIGSEIFLCPIFAPRIDARFPHTGNDAGIDGGIIQILARLAVDKQSDRHAPRTLAAQHPVGAPFDHGGDAVLALFRHPACLRNRGHRLFTQGAVGHRLVHRHEPLRRAAINDLGL